MELINVQMPSNEFHISDYNYGYKGILIAIKNNNSIGMIIVGEEFYYLITDNIIGAGIGWFKSIEEIIDKYEITELKLIKFS